jgi:hypothetical protein
VRSDSVAGSAAGSAPVVGVAPHQALRAHVSRYVQLALDVPRGESMRHQLSALTGSVAAVIWSGEVNMEGTGVNGPIKQRGKIGPMSRWHHNNLSGWRR